MQAEGLELKELGVGHRALPVSNFLSSKQNPGKAEGRAARQLGGPLDYFEASLFDLPDEDGRTAFPPGSSLESLLPS